MMYPLHAYVYFFLPFQTLPHRGPDMYVLYYLIAGPECILILPFGRPLDMYDCPIVELDCIFISPVGRVWMYVWTLPLGGPYMYDSRFCLLLGS